MSVVAAVSYDGGILMGSDTLCTSSNRSIVIKRHNPKSFVLETPNEYRFIAGAVGAYRFIDLMRWDLNLPRLEGDIQRYVSIEIANAVRTAVVDNGHSIEKSGMDKIFSGRLLIGIDGRLFEVGDDFNAGEIDIPFWAIGSGQKFAIGAMDHAFEVEFSNPVYDKSIIKKKMRKVLDVGMSTAAKFDPAVNDDFNYHYLKELTE